MEYAAIIERLEAIESDLAERQNEYEQAASDIHRLTREFELRVARTSLKAQGATATEKKWRALEAIAAADDDLYSRLTEAEGMYEGLKAAVRVLEQRATIGMSLLKSQTREASVQPAWSQRRAA